MKVTFQDLQNDDNPLNGQTLNDPQNVVALLDEMKRIRPPFMCQLVGDNGYNLIVGIGKKFGCVQHAANDGALPYLLAVGPSADQPEMEFLLGNTPTPIDGRNLLPFRAVQDVVATFVETGQPSGDVEWEEV